jgi:hypothetical protein
MIKGYHEFNESARFTFEEGYPGKKYIQKFKSFFTGKEIREVDKTRAIDITEDDIIEIKQILNLAKDEGIGTHIAPRRTYGGGFHKMTYRCCIILVNPDGDHFGYRFSKEEFEEKCENIVLRLLQVGIFDEEPIYSYDNITLVVPDDNASIAADPNYQHEIEEEEEEVEEEEEFPAEDEDVGIEQEFDPRDGEWDGNGGYEQEFDD